MNAATATIAVHAADDGTQIRSVAQSSKNVGSTTPNQKTPVSFLQEVCAKRQIIPRYELLKCEGHVHDPTFQFSVTVEDLYATGSGRSKKYSKHLAAKNLLDRVVQTGRHQIWGIPRETVDDAYEFINSLMPPEPVVTPAGDVETAASENGKSSENSVGILQEICLKKKWPPPTYELIQENGFPHSKIFSVTVRLGKYQETGTGKSKKSAKREAAEKMIAILSDLEKQEKNSETSMIRTNEEELATKFTQIMSEMGHKAKKLTSDDISDVQKFFDYLKREPKLDFDRATETASSQAASLNKINFVQILKQISEAGQFDIIYVDGKDKSFCGEFQCLAQVNVKPIGIVYGSGKTVDDARHMAAYHALEYLKIITSG